MAPDWLNDAVRAHRDVLPSDFHERLTLVGTFGQLTVECLGRRDLILMKLAAGLAISMMPRHCSPRPTRLCGSRGSSIGSVAWHRTERFAFNCIWSREARERSTSATKDER